MKKIFEEKNKDWTAMSEKEQKLQIFDKSKVEIRDNQCFGAIYPLKKTQFLNLSGL